MSTDIHTKLIIRAEQADHPLCGRTSTPSTRTLATRTFIYKLVQAYCTSTHHALLSVLPDAG